MCAATFLLLAADVELVVRHLGVCEVPDGLEALVVNMNRSPLDADSLSLRLSGMGPKRSFEANEEPLKTSREFS